MVGRFRYAPALAALLLAVALLLAAAVWRSAALSDDDGTTTASVLEATGSALARAHAAEAESWPDARERLRVSAIRLAEEPYVAYVWLARTSGRGRVSYTSGGPAAQGDDILDLAGVVGEAAQTSEAWAAGGPERYVPIAAAAMSRDGDHGDVFRYLAVPVRFADGDGAIMAVAYDRTPAVSNYGVLYPVLLLGGLGSLVASAYLAFVATRRPRHPREVAAEQPLPGVSY